MHWILIIMILGPPSITKIGPFNSETSCESAKAIISKGISNVKFNCIEIVKGNR